jgi:hypothetical protein
MMGAVIRLTLILFLAPCLCRADASKVNTKQTLPFEEKINQIMGSVNYSGIQALMRPEVVLKIDFKKRAWTLSHIHQYDAKGDIVLEQGRHGLCADLATYVYQEIKSDLTDDYEIRFASSTESRYFPNYESNHIVLLMSNKADQNIYLIDPSFRQYGNIKEFNQYKIFGTQENLTFLKEKAADESYLVDQARPLLIKEDLLLSFSVLSVDGKFDQDNFMFTLSVTRQNQTGDLSLLLIGKRNGQIESFENRSLLGEFINPQEIQNLHRKLTMWLLQN